MNQDDPLEKARHAYAVQRGIKWHGKAGGNRAWSTLRGSPTLRDVEVSLVFRLRRDFPKYEGTFYWRRVTNQFHRGYS